MLLTLFKLFCFNCKERGPTVRVYRTGSMATVVQSCKHCNKEYQWNSQPTILGRYPAGNIMMSFAILMSGVSISQALLMFKHMGLAAISIRTFFYHQKEFLFPSVLLHWERYRSSLINKISGLKDIEWSGDGRFDSMGHNAKYGVYSMFCNTISKLVHFELVQVGTLSMFVMYQNYTFEPQKAHCNVLFITIAQLPIFNSMITFIRCTFWHCFMQYTVMYIYSAILLSWKCFKVERHFHYDFLFMPYLFSQDFQLKNQMVLTKSIIEYTLDFFAGKNSCWKKLSHFCVTLIESFEQSILPQNFLKQRIHNIFSCIMF